MDARFSPHNTHLIDLDRFIEMDPHLARLKDKGYQYQSPLMFQFPVNQPGIYSLAGGRQVGKSTLLKQWMLYLMLEKSVQPQNIAFISGEIIDDQHSLLNIMQSLIPQDSSEVYYLIIDEVTYINAWDKAIKYAADAALLQKVALFLTGSDLILMQEAKQTFPGRRGTSDIVDFHLYPLSFREVLNLKSNLHLLEPTEHEKLLNEFYIYTQHGGYMTAINDLATHGRILNATFATYSDWIRGDVLKKGKREIYLREIVLAIIKKYSSQLGSSWHALAKELSIDHHKTVSDYVDLLASMDALYVQSALQEDKLLPAPKKAKKIMFTDPFIYHAIYAWLHPVENIYADQVALLNHDIVAKLVETIVITHFRRKYPTYYIKAEGEVDLAYVADDKFWPIEVMWTQQIRSKDIKQAQKYQNAKLYTKISGINNIHGIPATFLPQALGEMDF